MEAKTSEAGLITVPAKTNSYELTSGVTSDESSRSRKFTSLDMSDEAQQDLLLSAMEEVDTKLNEHVGEVIDVIGYYVVEHEVDTANEETGEVITRKKHALVLFDENHKSYATGSNACFMSFSNIVSIKGIPTPEHPLRVQIIETPAKEKGHNYLKLKPVVDKGE